MAKERLITILLAALVAWAPTALTQTGADSFQRIRVTSTAGDAIDVGGGINAGTGNVPIVGADGRIPALSSTELANLSGANLTALNGSQITTGTVAMARLSTSGVCSGATFLRGDQACSVPTVGTLVSGVVVFAAGPVCPAGFSEFLAARGRMIVGLPLSGTNQGTIGTALTDLQNKTHVHADGTLAVGSHDHQAGTWTTTGPSAALGASTNNVEVVAGTGVFVATGTHSHNMAHTHDVSQTTTGLTAPDVTGSTASALTSDVVSYIQLIACVSN